MPITIDFLLISNQSIVDAPGILEFIAQDAEVDGTIPNSFGGSGDYQGNPAAFQVIGTGFGPFIVQSTADVVTGVIDSATFITNSGADVESLTDVDIDMADFAPVINADNSGADSSAIEDFLLARDWKISLSNADDIAPEGTLFGDDVLFNLQGNDVINARGGDDNLFSGDGRDKLIGGSGNDRLDGGEGKDRVIGGQGKDVLRGSGGNDRLEGGNGGDKLFGGAGHDILIGGKGNDILNGGGGNDDFIFADGQGINRIAGFEADNNAEDIDLSAVSAITSFNDLVNNHMTQNGNRVLIKDGNGLRINVLGTDIDDMNQGDFIFA